MIYPKEFKMSTRSVNAVLRGLKYSPYYLPERTKKMVKKDPRSNDIGTVVDDLSTIARLWDVMHERMYFEVWQIKKNEVVLDFGIINVLNLLGGFLNVMNGEVQDELIVFLDHGDVRFSERMSIIDVAAFQRKGVKIKWQI